MKKEIFVFFFMHRRLRTADEYCRKPLNFFFLFFLTHLASPMTSIPSSYTFPSQYSNVLRLYHQIIPTRNAFNNSHGLGDGDSHLFLEYPHWDSLK